MTSICKAYDNIRLLRRKLRIVETDAQLKSTGPQRDAAIARVYDLQTDLVRALQDFADLGYEQQLAALIDERSAQTQPRNGRH